MLSGMFQIVVTTLIRMKSDHFDSLIQLRALF